MRALTDLEKYRLALSLDPLFFAEEMYPHLFDVPWAPFQRKIADVLTSSHPSMITALLVAREFGKSMLASFVIPKFMMLFHGFRYTMIASNTEARVKEIIQIIKDNTLSERFIEVFGKIGDIKGRSWSSMDLEFYSPELGIDARILGRTPGKQVLGLNWKGIRPQLFIGDDLESEETVENVDNIDKSETWINKSVIPGLKAGKKSRVFLIGTTLKDDSSIGRFADKTRYPKDVTTIKFPAHATEETAEHCGVKPGEFIWKDNVNLHEKVNRIFEFSIANNQMHSYNCNYALDPTKSDVDRFLPENILSFNPSDPKVDLRKQKICLLVDAAYGKNLHNDEVGLSLVGCDSGYIYVWEAQKGRWGENLFMRKIVDVVSDPKYKPYVTKIWIESIAHGFLKRLLSYEMMKRGCLFSVGKLEHHNRPKEERIKPLVPYTEMKRVLIREGQPYKTLRGEMLAFHGKAKQKGINILDATSYILDVNPRIIGKPEDLGEGPTSKAGEIAYAKFIDKHFRKPLQQGLGSREARMKAIGRLF